MRIFFILMACVARASYGRRVQNDAYQGASSQPVPFEALSALLQASKSDAAWQVAGTGPRGNLVVQKSIRQNRPSRTAAVRMEEEEATLEEQLKNGDINQEEYDLLSSAIEEDEYLEELTVEPEKALSPEAQEEQARLTSESGREFAPWMKVDPEAIVVAKKERAALQERLAAEKAKKKAVAAFLDTKAAGLGVVGTINENILSTGEAELRWTLNRESKENKGFNVERSKAGTDDWETLASWKETATLKSKGVAGGTYLYVDDTASVGNWVYRIIAESNKGRSVVTKKLLQIESSGDGFGRFATIAAVIVFFILAYVAISNAGGDSS